MKIFREIADDNKNSKSKDDQDDCIRFNQNEFNSRFDNIINKSFRNILSIIYNMTDLISSEYCSHIEYLNYELENPIMEIQVNKPQANYNHKFIVDSTNGVNPDDCYSAYFEVEF